MRQQQSFAEGLGTGQVDRGRAKTQRNFANNRAERNYSRFFRFQAIWGLEKANKIGPCENALEFSHSLDPKRAFAVRAQYGRNARKSGHPPVMSQPERRPPTRTGLPSNLCEIYVTLGRRRFFRDTR